MKTKKKFVKTLFVNRAKWGFGSSGGKLLRYDGKMCCLGFSAKKCNYSDKEILNRDMPSDLHQKGLMCSLTKRNAFGNLVDEKIAEELSEVNDAISGPYRTSEAKERRIKQLFAKLGTKVTFTGKFSEDDK